MSGKEKSRPRLSIMPARAVRDKSISAQALRVLALLGCHTDDDGWCRRSQVRMAEELGVVRGTIQNCLQELVPAYVERREETRPGVRPEPGRHPHCSYSYRVRLDLEDDAPSGANLLAPSGANQMAGGANLEKHPVPISLAPLTERPLGNDPLGNASAPDGAGESGKMISRGEGEVARWAEFRSVVDKSWPGGFPPKDEVACRKQFEPLAREHGAGLLMICAQLHGDEERRIAEARERGAGKAMLKRPSNWLREGEWQGYIPQAEALAGQHAEMTTALGRVRRSLGDGLFRLFRDRMGDAGLAKLDGVTIEPKARFLISRPVQRTLLEKHCSAIERHLGEPPTFTAVAERKAS